MLCGSKSSKVCTSPTLAFGRQRMGRVSRGWKNVLHAQDVLYKEEMWQIGNVEEAITFAVFWIATDPGHRVAWPEEGGLILNL